MTATKRTANDLGMPMDDETPLWRDEMWLEHMSSRLALLSEAIDTAPANAARDPEALTWGRVSKVAEECGEAVQAWIGATGQNPRKGHTHSRAQVVTELLDVAVTALAAVEHFAGNDGSSMDRLTCHVAAVCARLWVPS